MSAEYFTAGRIGRCTLLDFLNNLGDVIPLGGNCLGEDLWIIWARSRNTLFPKVQFFYVSSLKNCPPLLKNPIKATA